MIYGKIQTATIIAKRTAVWTRSFLLIQGGRSSRSEGTCAAELFWNMMMLNVIEKVLKPPKV